MSRAWSFRQQQAIAEARDRFAVVLRGCGLSRPEPAAILEIAAAASYVGLSFPDETRYHVKVLLRRRARPVEIVNAVVARHFRVSTNDVQLARRDIKSTFHTLEGFEFQ